MSVEQIAERLDDFFGLLTSGSRAALPRQRTLRATIDWSHDLLSEEERVLFRRLSVFAGGCALEAAEEVCSGDGLERDEVLDVLARLVEKLLVVMRERGGDARYRSVEIIRRYCQEKLEVAGEAQAVRRSHAAYFLRMAEEAEPHLTGPEQGVYLDLLEDELDKIDLLGHSFGGALVQAYAFKYQQNLSHLILGSTFASTKQLNEALK